MFRGQAIRQPDSIGLPQIGRDHGDVGSRRGGQAHGLLGLARASDHPAAVAGKGRSEPPPVVVIRINHEDRPHHDDHTSLESAPGVAHPV